MTQLYAYRESGVMDHRYYRLPRFTFWFFFIHRLPAFTAFVRLICRLRVWLPHVTRCRSLPLIPFTTLRFCRFVTFLGSVRFCAIGFACVCALRFGLPLPFAFCTLHIWLQFTGSHTRVATLRSGSHRTLRCWFSRVCRWFTLDLPHPAFCGYGSAQFWFPHVLLRSGSRLRLPAVTHLQLICSYRFPTGWLGYHVGCGWLPFGCTLLLPIVPVVTLEVITHTFTLTPIVDCYLVLLR